jgi:hypothetical protein
MATNGFRDFPKPGLGSVGSYQMSGTPFVTGTILQGNQEVHFAFPSVTKEFTVFTNKENVYLTFLATGSDAGVVARMHRVMIIPTGTAQPYTFNAKCKDIFIHKATANAADVTVYASLTGIEAGNMFHLTGSGISE